MINNREKNKIKVFYQKYIKKQNVLSYIKYLIKKNISIIITKLNNPSKKSYPLKNTISDNSTESGKKAIFLHIYYPYLCNEILKRLKKIPFKFNLYVNLVRENSDHLKNTILKNFPDAKINISPNQGMDPGGQLRTLDYWLKNGSNEEFLIFIHTKRNNSLRDLFMSIISPRKIPLIEQAFLNKNIGMVGVKEWNLSPGIPWGDPIDFCDYYCNILKLNNFKNDSFGFIGGTMFWVRAEIYKKVFKNIDIIKLVEELEPYSNGGKIHALERIFGYIVLSEGYKIQGI